MADVVWIEADWSDAPSRPYREMAPAEAVDGLDRQDGDYVAVIGATVAEPLELARRLNSRRENAPVLIVCEPQRYDRLRNSMQIDPLLGSNLEVVSTEVDLEDAVERLVEAESHRRELRRVLDRSESKRAAAESPDRSVCPEQYRQLMWAENPSGALVVRGDRGRIVGANPAATDLLGADEIELVGTPLAEVLHDETVDDPDVLSRDSDESPGETVVSHSASDDARIHLSVQPVPIESADQNTQLVFLRDVTDRVRFERLQTHLLTDEHRAREKMERRLEDQEDVLHSVSHDLRSPLQSILVSTRLLRDSFDDPKLQEIAESVEFSAKYMNQLANDLLDLARIEESELYIEPRSVPVVDVVDEAVDLVVHANGHLRHRIQTESVDPSLTFEVDRDRVVRALANVLDNGLKYSPQDEPVEVRCDERGDAIRLSVTDRGPGIPPEEIPHLTERFWRSDERSDVDGTGLGLTIVEGIAHAHDGSLSVESEVGEGSTFSIDLPKTNESSSH